MDYVINFLQNFRIRLGWFAKKEDITPKWTHDFISGLMHTAGNHERVFHLSVSLNSIKQNGSFVAALFRMCTYLDRMFSHGLRLTEFLCHKLYSMQYCIPKQTSFMRWANSSVKHDRRILNVNVNNLQLDISHISGNAMTTNGKPMVKMEI